MSSTDSSSPLEAIHIKARYNDELYRFTLPEEMPFDDVSEYLEHRFSLHGHSYSIKYLDEDGDMITVTSQVEWEEAVDLYRDATLKIQITPVRVSKMSGSLSSSGSTTQSSGSGSSSGTGKTSTTDLEIRTAQEASRPTTLPSSALRTSKKHEKFQGDVDVISSQRSQFTFGDNGKSACTFFCVEAASRFILDPSTEFSVDLLDSILDECMKKWESSGAANRKVEHAASMEVISFVPEYDNDVRLVEHLIHQAGIPRARKGAVATFAKWIANAVHNWQTITEEEEKEYTEKGIVAQTRVYPTCMTFTSHFETVLIIVNPDDGNYIIFDSHTRLFKGESRGCSFYKFDSLNAMAEHLADTFPCVSGMGQYNAYDITPLSLNLFNPEHGQKMIEE